MPKSAQKSARQLLAPPSQLIIGTYSQKNGAFLPSLARRRTIIIPQRPPTAGSSDASRQISGSMEESGSSSGSLSACDTTAFPTLGHTPSRNTTEDDRKRSQSIHMPNSLPRAK